MHAMIEKALTTTIKNWDKMKVSREEQAEEVATSSKALQEKKTLNTTEKN